ncbi:DUF1983 domain-containing protein [Klebsiella oxytoca]|uniref:TipJ family phage tail tip protein n=1 Tax=Klebsiella oxytoca TaxID=571 RepID=UPI001CC9F5B1|nr:DUF1983 domain-containing protein [Klebsiella oxytoca]MBZ7632773.1 DUF1983 domain-containing protein [Klebsiella oxytoca]
MRKLISGRKGGGGSSHTPVESPDDLQSVAKAKMLIALGEGEFYGQLTGQQIFLDGTPLESDDGTQNFAGVKWEFRPGTQDQKYIPGMPGTENEISLNNVELKSGKPWVRTITNTTLSALRFRFKWPSLITQHDNGDVTGAKVNYKIEIQTDGGAWETFIETAVDGKTTSGYERSHRVTLPEAKTSWTVRITKTSEDNSSLKVSDTMNLESYTEVIDVKLRYPNTALLYIEFDASQFNGEIPPVTCEPYGRIVRVPDNYDPQARTYNGTWGGAFKWAWTNNPAWIFYDIIVEGRFGLGRNIKPENISKWHLYTIARYCDELVPDGKGGDGKEPRYLCDVYIQERNAAYNFVRDFSAIFGGMVCWSGEQILVTADMPRDVDYNFTRANTVGQPRYSSTTAKDRYTNALVSWSDPANGYSEAVQPAFVTEYVARYDFQQVEVTAIGCTRQSEAYRRGLWAIYTNNRDRVIDIDVGMDGKIPQPGYIFSYADERLAGRVIGGRISAVNGRVITLDRDIPAEAGDRLQINLPSGLSQARTIQSINGKRQVTVTTEYSETPEAQAVWLVEYSDLYAQQYRTLSVKNNNDGTYTISGIFHDPDKYKRIDSGAIIDGRPISVLPGATQAAPDNITIKSTFVINQGIRIESMQVDWDMAKGAVSYEAQWRRNNDNWINIPRSSTTGFEVNGIYAGQYSVRVRAINAAGVSSSWGYAPVTTLNGKTGSPLAPIDFATKSILHGVSLSWEFPEDSGDTLKTEIEYSTDEAGTDARLLSDVAYPAKIYEQLGLSIGAIFFYRARLVDRSGNASRFTDWIIGQSSTDLDEYYKELDEAIKGTESFEKLQEDIQKGHQDLVDEAQKIRDELAAEVDEVNSHVDSTVKELKDSVTQQIKEGTDNLQNQINQSKEDIEQAQTDIGTANQAIEQQKKDTDSALEQVNKDIKAGDEANQKAIKTAENQLKQAIEQSNSGWKDAVEAEAQSRIDDVNSAPQKAADQLLNEKRDREAAITGLQQIVQEGDDSLARQIAEISAGSGQQFDSFKIYHFDKSAQGWTEDDAVNVVIPVTSEGWLKPANSTATCISPNGQAIPATAYRTVMMRVKRVGNPEWSGLFSWIGADETGWSNQRSMSIAAPEFDSNGVTVVMLADIPWNSSETIRRYKVAFTKKQDSNNYFLVNWVSVGRPAPGASTAALRDETLARTKADEAEATKRSTLAAQIRGTSDSNSLNDLRSGLIYDEKTARIDGDKAEASKREALQVQFNENKASVATELKTLTTAQSAQAEQISGLNTSLGKKADAAALQTLKTKVEDHDKTLSSQTTLLNTLSNRVGQTEKDGAANSKAISGLNSDVKKQGETLSANTKAITTLQGDLKTTNEGLSKKADQTALNSLSGKVDANTKGITATNANVTTLTAAVRAGNATSGDFIPNPTFDPAYNQMGFTVVSATADGVPKGCPFDYVARLAGRDHHPNFNNIVATLGDVFEMSVLVACGAGSAVFNLYLATALSPTGGVGAPLYNKTLANTGSWTRHTWRFTVTQAMVDRGYIRPFLQINQSNPFGTIWYATDWHMRNITAAAKAQTTADATAKAVDTLSNTVTQQGKDISSVSQRATQLENSVKTISGDVAKKADAEALQTLQNTVKQQGTTLSSHTESLTSLKNSLDSTVADMDASGKMPGNLIANPSFERGLTGYSGGASFIKVINASAPHTGGKILSCETGTASVAQSIAVTKDRTYRLGVWARCESRTVVDNTGNNKIRIGSNVLLKDFLISPADLPTGSTWKEIALEWKSTLTGNVDVSINSSLKAGKQYFDDFYFIDVTDRVNITANSSALTNLTSRVSTAEGKIESQSNQITTLKNSLAETDKNVAKKADALALQQLTSRVEKTESGLTSASTAITNLNNSIEALSNTGENLVLNYNFSQGSALWRTQENAQNPVTFGDYGDGGKGVKLVKVNGTASPGIFANNKRPVPITGQRKYRFVVRAKGVSGAKNILLRRWNYAAAKEGAYEEKSLTLDTAWKTYMWETSQTPASGVDGQAFGLYCHPSVAEIWIDNFRVFDITDEVNSSANAAALQTLQSTVKTQGDTLSSQGSAITKLENGLKTTNDNVARKADASALQTLQNTVKQQGDTLSAQSSTITELNSSLKRQEKRGANILPDGTFESYANGTSLHTTRLIVTDEDKFSGTRCLRASRANNYNPNSTDNNDCNFFSGVSARAGATFYVEFWAKPDPKATTMAENVQLSVGFSFQDMAGSWQWPAITRTKKDLSGGWTKVSGYLTCDRKTLKQAMVRISIPNVSTVKAGDAFLIDELMITEVTDAKKALDNAEVNAKAITSLSSTVTQQGKDITSQGSVITNLQNSLKTTNENLAKKADAQALQTLQNTVKQQGDTLSTNSSAITQMQNAITGINADEALSVSMPGNQISNASFENGLTNYFGTNGSTVVEKLQVPHSGTAALKITGQAAPGQNVNFVKGNSYLIGVWAKQLGGTTDNGDGDNKIRVGGASGQPIFTKTFSSEKLDSNWRLVADTWKATESGKLPVSLNNRITAGARYFDSFHVIDVTDRVNLDATATALQTLQNTVKQQGDTVSSHTSAITNLQNSLKTTNENVAKKADASALQTLQNTVKQQGDTLSAHTSSITKLESSLKTTNDNVAKKADQTALNTLSGKVDTNTKGISAANTSITTLTAAVRAGNATSGDLITNPTFDPVYNQMGFTVVSATADGVPKGCPFGYAAKLAARDHHPNFSSVAATVGDVYEISVLVACGTGSADFNIYIGTAATPNGGISAPLSSGGNTKKTSAWTRATWRFTVTQAMVDRGYIRPFLQINQSNPFGTIWYATDWHWRNITAAAKAQTTADATAKAVDTLSNTVTQQGKDISSISGRTTSLENGLKTTNDNVAKKADAAALQTLQNTVKEQGNTLSSQSGALTELKNGLSSTNANVDGLRGMGGNIVENGDFSQGVACWGVQQNAQNPVTFGDYGDGAKGVKLVKTNSTSPGLFVNNKRPVPVDGQRRYRYIVRAKGVSGAKNMILRRWNYAGGKEGAYADKSFTLDSAWKTYTWETALSSTGVDAHAFGLYCHSAAAEIWIDSFYVFDITDEVEITANSAAISSLNSRVTKTEDGIKTQSESITKLTNSLNTTNQEVAKKADSSALKTLQSTVDEQGKKIDSQSTSITSLTNTVNTVGRKGSNPWIDSTFETYADGQKLAGGSQIVVGTSFTGTRSLRVTRGANTNGNADQLIGSRQAIRDDAVYRVEFWAMMPASENPSTGWNCAVGFHSQDKSGANNWQPGVYVNEAALGGRGKWVKFSGLAKNNKSGRTNAVIWISPRGANGANTPGYNLFIDNFVMTEVTDASAALDGVTATNTAVTSLTNRVKKTETDIEAQGKAVTSLKSEVDNKASASAVNELSTRVTKTEKTLETHTSQITGLSSSLKDKADASAVNKLTTRVTDAEGKLTSQAEMIGTINTNLYGKDGLNATVTTHGETLASNTNQLKAMYSIKVETNNGKKVGAGIVLGSDGSTSDMILYADRFSLFNRNNKTAVPVMIAEGNELYIDTARIKNASIGSAKIGDLQSNNYAGGRDGWRITKSGASEFNNVVVRGEVHANSGSFTGNINATSGTFRGAVEANSFVGDIAAMGVFPGFNSNVKSRLIHHDTSDKGGKSFCIQGIVRWIAGNERSTIGIECWVNGKRINRITFNASDIGSSLIGFLPFQASVSGIGTRDTLVEIVITNSIAASLISGTCIMSRGSGNWENIH